MASFDKRLHRSALCSQPFAHWRLIPAQILSTLLPESADGDGFRASTMQHLLGILFSSILFAQREVKAHLKKHLNDPLRGFDHARFHSHMGLHCIIPDSRTSSHSLLPFRTSRRLLAHISESWQAPAG
ncbi:hypothetical protein BJY00DRAFT_292721 [Aspergillus carlsbadensis]|nr:hypothetical protein BJY00DRAFT_292721 [Aspergillus carlsbadensis]